MSFEYDYRRDASGTRNWHEEDDPWKAKNIHTIISKNNINPKSICEVGYGAGGLLLNLAEYYKSDVQFYGYETLQEAYNISKPKETENVHFYYKDLLKEDAYYDVVMAINVFTHIRDYLGFLSKLRTKGEYKVFHISLQITLYTVIRSQYFQNKDYMRSQLHYFNKDTALGTLKGTGYEIIDYFYTSRSLDLPKVAGKEKLWKFSAKVLSAINPDLAAKILGGFSLMVITK
jgi:hypothetical protein